MSIASKESASTPRRIQQARVDVHQAVGSDPATELVLDDLDEAAALLWGRSGASLTPRRSPGPSLSQSMIPLRPRRHAEAGRAPHVQLVGPPAP